MYSMPLTEAIEILRKHNNTGASVIDITYGRCTERELLDLVLHNCEKLLAQKTLIEKAVERLRNDTSAILEDIQSETYQIESRPKPGVMPLSKVAVGSVFTVGDVIMQKITDEYFTRDISKREPNTINLDNNHKCVMTSDLLVKVLDNSDSGLRNGPEDFKNLPVGTKFRYHDVIGVKLHKDSDIYRYLDLNTLKVSEIGGWCQVQVIMEV